MSRINLKTILLNHNTYEVSVEGNGDLSCICIGIGSLMQRTLSNRFKSIFTVYSCDLYWTRNHSLTDISDLSISKIVDDLLKVIDQLNLKKPIVLAHSTFGIIALEVAKRKNANIAGIIMIASPPALNTETLLFAKNYFNQHASPERKINDALRKEKFKLIKKPNESDISLNTYEADSARYWGDFNISRAFLEKLWENIEADDAIINHFFSNLLPNHNLVNNIEKITIPVLLAGGQLDFDCVPLELWKDFPKPKLFSIIDCGKVGHWPNLENSSVFDIEIENWINRFKLNIS